LRRGAQVSLLVLLLVAPGLLVKAAWSYHDVATDYRGGAQSIARSFAARGWSAETVNDDSFPYARLANGDCTMVAAPLSPNGALDTRFTMQMREYGPVTYFYRDGFQAIPSRVAPSLSDYLHRKLRPFGIAWDIQPIIAIAAGPRCRLSPADWRAIRVGTTIGAV